MACDQYIQTPYGMALVVSSTTRPTTAPDLGFGRFIAEADTGRVLFYDGTNWVIMFEPVNITTPTLTGMAVGVGGTNTMTWHRSDGYLDFEWRAVFGSSGQTFPTNPTVALPVAMADSEGNFTGNLLDSGVFRYSGLLTTGVSPALTIGTFAANSVGITTTTPFTWGATDAMLFRGRYRMTTRYS